MDSERRAKLEATTRYDPAEVEGRVYAEWWRRGYFTPAAAGMCAIRRLDPGTLEGGADPRRESYAIGW